MNLDELKQLLAKADKVANIAYRHIAEYEKAKNAYEQYNNQLDIYKKTILGHHWDSK